MSIDNFQWNLYRIVGNYSQNKKSKDKWYPLGTKNVRKPQKTVFQRLNDYNFLFCLRNHMKIFQWLGKAAKFHFQITKACIHIILQSYSKFRCAGTRTEIYRGCDPQWSRIDAGMIRSETAATREWPAVKPYRSGSGPQWSRIAAGVTRSERVLKREWPAVKPHQVQTRSHCWGRKMGQDVRLARM